MTATTITTIAAANTTTSSPQHHGGQHKKCNSATCCSPSKIWRAIQTAISADDKEGLNLMFQDQERVPHIKNVLIKERNVNDASALPPSHKHRILQFNKTVRLDATKKFGRSVTDLNGLQVALFHGREDIACQLLYFLRQHASPTELDSFLGHVWGKGNSSLHLACFHGMPRLVQLLLEMGADPHVTNACHFKPADCCKDPGCLAVLEKATTSITRAADHEQHDSPDSSVGLISPSPPSSLGGRRRGSAGLLGLPTSKSFSPGMKRHVASSSVNSTRSFVSSSGPAEKKIRSGVSSASPPATPMVQSPLVSTQEQPVKDAPKDSLVLSSLHDNNNTLRQPDEADIKELPPPVMRRSLALRPTPETERPVSVPEVEQLEEESTPATAATAQHQQEEQREEEQQCQSANTTPTVPGDSVTNRHHSELFHHSTQVIGQESALSPNLSVLSPATSDDDSNRPSMGTLLSPSESSRTRTTALASMCPKQSDEVDEARKGSASLLLSSTVAENTLVPDIEMAQQVLSPQLLHQKQQDIKTSQGSSFKVSISDRNYQVQRKSERMKHERNNIISTTEQSRNHQQQQAIETGVNNPYHQLYSRDYISMITRNIALVFASQNLMMNVYSFAKEISDQADYGNQYDWNRHHQEETAITNGTSMSIGIHHGINYHHNQHHYNLTTEKTAMESKRHHGFFRSCGSGAMYSLLGDSQGIRGQQQSLRVAVL